MNPQTFDVRKVPLSKISMVDASAGTGKTYSIALLVIRLILEKDMDIRTILVLTFTKAATREIQGRIQAFLQELHNCCEYPKKINDSPLHACLPRDPEQRREAQRQIARALLFIDEAPIYTIHGFCQKMLSTHPFETGNLFSPVVLEDSAELHTRFINVWWRKCMAHSKPRHLHLLAPHILHREKLSPLVSAILAGKEIDPPKEVDKEIDPPKEVDIERALTEKEEALSRCEEERQKLCNDEAALEELRAVLIEERAKKRAKFIETLLQVLETHCTPKDLIKEIFTQAGDVRKDIARRENLMETELISTLISLRNKEKECKADSDKQCLCAAQHLAWIMAQAAAHDIRQYKREHSLLEFDDLIFHLHRVVCDESPRGRAAAEAISRDYNALFIDEFQDTDQRQFEILNALFGEKPCFYIGDPKQSIYGWRGADLDTYFMVRREKIDALYSMKECFRSTPNLVSSFNTFFGATDSFFEHPELSYTEVEGKNDTPWDTPPLTVYTGGAKRDEIIALSADRITQFLIEHREVSLEKCAVLVRAHREAADIKAALARRGVPAVTIDDSSLFATKAAEDLQGVLEALVSGEDRQFRRALISPLCGFSAQDIAAMPAETYEEHLRRFRLFAQIWEEHGLAAALTALISEYALRERVFVYSSLEQGERFFADLMHLMDCLVFETVKNGLTVEEQLLFLQRQIGKETSQKRRVENDSNSLQIVTIHKSKGLTYDHVFCPFLNASEKKKPSPLTLVKTDRGYRFIDFDQDQAYLKKEALQENRRLIYVAMTRARFSCTLCIGKKVKDGTVNLAEGALKECVENVQDNSAIQIIPLDVQDITDVRYTAPEEILPGTKRELKHRENLRSQRDVSSFSALSNMHGLPPEGLDERAGSAYDEWIFTRRGGALLGNFLHDIFETIDFTAPAREDILQCGKKHPLVFTPEDMPRYEELCRHTLGAGRPGEKTGFSLGEIPRQDTLREMEFYFSLESRSDFSRIGEVMHRHFGYDFTPRREHMPGFIKGFIDLIFEYAGQYYILDWKSNSLGRELFLYENTSLEQAMCDSNYHFQYALYTLALKRYMESRGIDFLRRFGGVYYLFLRGVREGTSTGVYYAPPKKVLSVVDELEKFFG